MDPNYPNIDKLIKGTIPPDPPLVIVDIKEVAKIKKANPIKINLEKELQTALTFYKNNKLPQALEIYKKVLVFYPNNSCNLCMR